MQKFSWISTKIANFQIDFLIKIWDCSGEEVYKSCRAWKMLQGAYLLAKFGFDTAENEPAEELQKLKFCKKKQIFGGLVLGCIKANFCKKICLWQHFSSSTRFEYFCKAALSKFSQKIGLKNQQFSWKFSKHFANVAKSADVR